MIEIADISFRMPIEVLYDEEKRVILGARFVVPNTGQYLDITGLFSGEDWAEVLDSMKEGGYLRYDVYNDMLPPALEGEE